MVNPVIIDNLFKGELSRNLDDYPEGLLFLIDKPYRWTSSDVVRKLKYALQRHFGVRNIKIGHAGTLDPLATGLLIICAGKATKIAEMLQSHEKEYVAGISFGATTPSFDLEKDIDTFWPFEHITEKKVAEACRTFIGEQDQIPPMFSAKMVNGTRAYEYAREGESIPLRPSRITISEIEILHFDPHYIVPETQAPIRTHSETVPMENAKTADGPRPMATIRLKCSKGTYIRSFARDLGLALDSGAFLCSLQRTISGNFSIKNANSLDNLITRINFAGLK